MVIVVDPADYGSVLEDLRRDGTVSPERRRELARKAFAATAAYDGMIANWLGRAEEGFGCTMHRQWQLVQTLRYGENPHQVAGLYAQEGLGPLGGELLQGKPLSYNNLLDLDAAWSAALSFAEPTIVIVKHLSPCGIASADRLAAAFPEALASDPVSAFGGVIAANRPMDCATTKEMQELFVEAVVAPGFDDEALEYFTNHKPNCRLVAVPDLMPAV